MVKKLSEDEIWAPYPIADRTILYLDSPSFFFLSFVFVKIRIFIDIRSALVSGQQPCARETEGKIGASSQCPERSEWE